MVYMPGAVQDPAWKLARPFHGPYRVVTLTPSNAEVILIDKPKEPSTFVVLNRIRCCYDEMEDTSWTGPRKNQTRKPKDQSTALSNLKDSSPRQGPVTRSMGQVGVNGCMYQDFEDDP